MKHVIIKYVWIIGWSIGIFAAFLVGVLLPITNRNISNLQVELSSLEWERDVRMKNFEFYQHYGLIERLCRIDMYLLNLLKDEEEKKNTFQELMKNRVWAHSHLFTAETGELASKELERKWNKMSREELLAEEHKMLEKETFSLLSDKIKEKKIKIKTVEQNRICLIIVTTLTQVIALALLGIFNYLKNFK
jgi:hypothetical protein